MRLYCVLFLCFFILIGCSSMNQLGVIGNHEVYKVSTASVFSPCTTTIFTHNVKDGSLTMVNGGTGPSPIGQLAGPAAIAGGAYFIGKGIGDSGDMINVKEGDVNSDNVTSSKSGSLAGSNANSESKSNSFSEVDIEKKEIDFNFHKKDRKDR